MENSIEITKDKILSKLNIEEFYRKNVKSVSNVNAKQMQCLCPFHEDKTASMSVDLEKGLFNCFACGAKGSLFDFYSKIHNCDFITALNSIAKEVGIEPTKFKSKIENIIDKKIADEHHNTLLNSKDLLNAFITKRGISLDYIKLFNIGYDLKSNRYTIPVYDEHNNLVNIRKYDMNSGHHGYKMLNYVEPLKDKNGNDKLDDKGKIIYEHKWGTVRIFNIKRLLSNDKIMFCEGETDCIIAEQYGIPTVTATGGAGTFKQDWKKYFKNKIVYICYDLDTAGRKGALRVAEQLRDTARDIKIINLPEELGTGGDITDFFIKFKYNIDKFNECISKAISYNDLIKKREDEIAEIKLSETTQAKYMSKKISTEVLVSGKSQPAYLIPSRIMFFCNRMDKKCDDCVLAETGEYEYIVDPKKPEMLELINVSKDAQENAIRNLVKTGCGKCELSYEDFVNVEEIKAVPKVDMNITSTEYVEKTLYYLGEGIKTNQSYRLEGYVFPEPRKQLATVIVEDANESLDNVDAFELTDEIKEQLKIFQLREGQKIWSEKLKEEYADFERNVHHIWGREDMMFAFDLVFHSPLYFNYEGDTIKGWINALIIGDTATGKTELITKMREHYGVGERIGGQGLTIPGLIGTVNQMDSGRWALRWGLLPLNDRRALVIEEVTDMPQEIMEKLTDIMSSGRANINKANGNECTNARTRLLFVTNTKRGAKLESYGNGPDAIREIIRKDEDIRRMDFILTVAKHEVDSDIINRSIEEVPAVPHIYTSQACRYRILWCWSRKPEQIIFTPEAQKEIFHVTKRLTSKYYDKFPLLESGDTKNKIRRESTSLAGMLVSTDDTFEKIIVHRDHVLCMEWWLNHAYCKASMGFDLYSEDAKRKYEMIDDKRKSLVDGFKMLPDWGTLSKVLWESQIFRKVDVQDRVGYANKDDIRIVFKWLSNNWLIRSVGNHGYVKERNLVTILREMIQNELHEPSNVYFPEKVEHHHHHHTQEKEVEPKKEIVENTNLF